MVAAWIYGPWPLRSTVIRDLERTRLELLAIRMQTHPQSGCEVVQVDNLESRSPSTTRSMRSALHQ
jgi:hypothetical protein